MRVDVTIRGPAGNEADVAIVGEPGLPVADVVERLRAAVGAEASAPLWVAEQLLGPDDRVGHGLLRSGSVLSVRGPDRTPWRPGVLSLHVVGGPGAGRVVAVERGRLTIGRAPECSVVLDDDRTSRTHAVLDVGSATLQIADAGSTNGTFVDGQRIGETPQPLGLGQLVRLGDTMITVTGAGDMPAAVTSSDGALVVNRAPRQRLHPPEIEIAVPERSRATRPRPVQLIAALLPALAGCAIAWAMHSPQFLLFALLSPLLLVSTAVGDRLHWRRSRRREAATFRRRHALAKAAIDDALAVETQLRRAAHPDPAAVLRMARGPTCRLWERRRGDPDLLRLRLGVADLPSVARARTGARVDAAGTAPAVPFTVDLMSGPLGLAGPSDVIDSVAPWVVAQLAATHSPADLEFALFLSPDAIDRWAWARWLPQVRRVAVGRAEWVLVSSELSSVRAGARTDRGPTGPWTVLIVDRAAATADVPALAALLAGDPGLATTALCFDTDAAALPLSCATVARVVGDTGSRMSVRGAATAPTEVIADRVPAGWAEQVARGLAPLVDATAGTGSAIPASCRLLDLLDIAEPLPDAFVRAWAEAAGGADTVIGAGPDGPVLLDLLSCGPHALVAGTTGAGKSELLQALVAGLAARHPPDQIAFLLVDYKGGAAFAECAELPHTVGLVTDLDAQLTSRALQSLDAELRRRERLLAAAGAADLVAYRAGSAGPPIARLVIVVDEFAALTEELPDFVRGLVAVAQRGRSLGVHLVLATQRPGSAVSPEIRANTSLRIALRVTDPSESTDVVEVPDAAAIPGTLPGRAVLRTGTSVQPFQTARISGTAPAATEASVVPLGPWRRPLTTALPHDGESDLARLVAALREAARRCGGQAAHRPWLNPLPAALPHTDLPSPTAAAKIGIGLVDLPAEPAQPALCLDLAAAASLLVVGGLRSGRTTALVTAAASAALRLSPEDLEIYVVDSAGALRESLTTLPHVATSAGPQDPAVVTTLLRRLEQRITSRLGSGPTSAEARLLLLVDGWDGLLARFDDATATRCTDLLTTLLRNGPGAGLTIVGAGGRAVLAPRTAGGFTDRVVLRLDDRADFGLAGVAARNVPSHLPPGRGLRVSDGAEIQFAHIGDRPDAEACRAAVRDIAAQWADAPPSRGAIRIRRLPESIMLGDLPAGGGHRITLGLGGDSAAPLVFDPFTGARRFLVAGPPRSGRTTALSAMLAQVAARGQATVVAATPGSPLAALARSQGVRVIGPDDPPESVGPAPAAPTLLLMDDSESFVDTPAGDGLAAWLRLYAAPLAVIVAGRTDDLATSYRGIAAEVRRSHCGLLLRPGPIDGDLLGVRLPRTPPGPPGRGVVVASAGWGPEFADGEPVPVQVARP